jgi:hypothetical protein
MTRIVAAVTLLLSTTVTPPSLTAQGGSGSPSFSYVEASGCDGLFLYAWNEARTEVLTIRVDRGTVSLVDGTTTVNLATTSDGVAVQAELTAARRETMPYCSEADQSNADRPSIWRASAGILKLVSRRRAQVMVTPVSVILENLVLAGPDGAETRSKRTIHFTAAVSDLTP